MKRILLFSTLLHFTLTVFCQNTDSLAAASQVDSLIQVSRALTGQGDFDKALEINAISEQIALEKFGRESAPYGSACFNHGRVLYVKGDFPEAEKWYLESKAIREKVLGKEHPDYAWSLNNLAILYSDMENYEKAEPLHVEALAIREKTLGKDHPDHASSLNNLGKLYTNIASYEKAEPLYIEALTIREKILGKEHTSYVTSLNNLAILYEEMGNYEKAEPLYLEVLAIREKTLGKGHPDYAWSLYYLASLYLDMGNYEKAEPLYLEALAIREKILGKEHPHYASNLNSLAIMYSNMGNYEKAEPLYLEALAIREKVLGREHPHYASILNNLAILYMRMGNYEKAEPLYLKTLAVQEKALGEKHPDYATSINNLAVLYWKMGNYEKAEQFYLEAFTVRDKTLGKEHPHYAGSLHNLGNLYVELGNYEKAELLFVEALAVYEKTLGKEHPDYALSLHNLGNLYVEMGNYEKAELLFVETHAVYEKTLGKEHPDYARGLISLAALYLYMGNYENAELLFVEALAVYEKTLGKEHSDYALVLNNLAGLYLDMSSPEKAELLFVEALTVWEKALGKGHPHYATGLTSLATLYKDMGNYDRAEHLLEEALAVYEKTLGKENPDYALSLHNLAILYEDLGNYEKSEPLYLESHAVRDKTLGKEHPDYAKSQHDLATFYWTVKKFDAAESFLSNALKSDESLLLKASRHLSERELTAYIRKFVDGANQLYSFAQTKAGEDTLCYDFALFHKGFLLNAVSQVGKLAQSDSATAEKYYLFKSYHRRLAAEYSKPIAERKNVAELEEKANALEKELTRTVAGFGEALRQVNWKDVQAALQPDEAAIEFVHYEFLKPEWTDSTLYSALVLLPQDTLPHLIPLFEQKQLDTLLSKTQSSAHSIGSLYAARSGIVLDEKPAYGTELYRLIWKPLDSLLNSPSMGGGRGEVVKTVYFSPSGLLHRINLAAIPMDTSHLLADKYILRQLSSTRSLVIKTPESVPADHTAALFGGIRYSSDSTALSSAALAYGRGSGEPALRSALEYASGVQRDTTRSWAYLPGTQAEVESLQRQMLHNGLKVKTLTGLSATEESLKALGRDTAKSPGILHIATHGFFFDDPERRKEQRLNDENVFRWNEDPLFRSGLILAGADHAWQTGRPYARLEDGICTAYEISHLNLSNTKLAVLSACETGLGDIKGSEGVYGLQRAFKIAGAKYVIMSLWQVPDMQTSLLMTTFYKKWLEDKMEIPDAFRAAQKEMRGRGFEPYQWAGFVLVE